MNVANGKRAGRRLRLSDDRRGEQRGEASDEDAALHLLGPYFNTWSSSGHLSVGDAHRVPPKTEG